MRRGTALLLALLLLPAACSEVASDGTVGTDPAPDVGPASEGEQLLRAITRAERTLVYSGYKTAVHGQDGGGRRTRMRVSRLEDGRMVLEWERGGETARRWVVRSRHRWIDDPELLLTNYDVVVVDAPEHDIAWRPVQRIDLRPRHPGRPTLTLLVDAETRLVLGERLLDHDAVRRFAWTFDTIDFEPTAPEFDEAEVVAAPQHGGADLASLGWVTLSAGETPAGFERVACRTDEDGGYTEYWSDGLAAFAFRQRRAGQLVGARDGELERRSCSGRSSVSGIVEGVEITLLGNLPIDALEAVAASLRIRP